MAALPSRRLARSSCPLTPGATGGHFLLIADLFDRDGRETCGNLIFCELCKCYFHKAAFKLAAPCTGRFPPGASGQASRLRRGLHPTGAGAYAGWRLSSPRQPSLLEALRCTDQLEATCHGGFASQGPSQPKKRKKVFSQTASTLQAMDSARSSSSFKAIDAAASGPGPSSDEKRRLYFEVFGSTAAAAAALAMGIERAARSREMRRRLTKSWPAKTGQGLAAVIDLRNLHSWSSCSLS